jgi:beta-glucuronidase
MARLRRHYLRPVTDLGGIWDFAFLGDVDPDHVNPLSIQFTDVMAVPGCFDATPAYAGKRGLTAYRTKAIVVDTALHRLVLDGVHHWGRVFVDGRRVCDHVGGFTRYHGDFQPGSAGEVQIVVLVDNRINYQRCPLHLEYFDWYHYGGIARGCELHRLGEVWIDDVQVRTDSYADRLISLSVRYGCAGDVSSLPKGEELDLEITCAGKTVHRALPLEGTGGAADVMLELPGAALWSPQAPCLHDLCVRLAGDDWRQRIGIRQVQAQGRDILLNGQPLRLLGVNRHEAHPQFGHTQPEQLMLADIQQIKDMGGNFIRGSHYPQDGRFLDLCDEMGICVWSESTGWQQTAEQLNDEHYMQAALLNVREMVAAAYNHPSVIIWGVLNEGYADEEACHEGYRRLIEQIRALDSTRLVTYAAWRSLTTKCLDLVDVFSINCYPGWYDGFIDRVETYMDKLYEHIQNIRWDKPVLMSEIGAAALYGFRDMNEDKWSEQYQAKLLDRVIRNLFIEHDRFSGLSIWQFADMRTSPCQAMGRARGFNNKGIVDEYRRPKEAYRVVQSLFKKLATECSAH